MIVVSRRGGDFRAVEDVDGAPTAALLQVSETCITTRELADAAPGITAAGAVAFYIGEAVFVVGEPTDRALAHGLLDIGLRLAKIGADALSTEARPALHAA